VYLLHFEHPYHHARHYIGVALDGDVERRFGEHLAGHGSPLVRAVVAAGIRVELALHVDGDRGLERRWYNRRGRGAALCPRCRERRAGARQLRLFARERRAAAPDPVRRIAA
jgi:hypothetical protein